MKDQKQDDSIDLYELLCTLWSSRCAMAIITGIFAIGGVSYALLATQLFRAEVVMIQTDEKKGLSGSLAELGGLASLAGINLASGGPSQAPVAVLKSKELARDFISDNHLIKVLLVDRLDLNTGDWKIRDPAKQPDIRDAVEYFQKEVCVINEDKKAGVVTLAITWRNAATSADWANQLAQRVNTKLRDEAVTEAERNIKYLKDEMSTASVTSMQQSIGRVLESEMQKLMLARGNDEYAFKVVDRAVAPRRRARPQRALISIVSTVVGFLVSIVVVIVRKGIRDRRASESAEASSTGGNASPL